MLNNVNVMGRLTTDPELKRTQSGVAVVTFSIACDRDYKSQDGERGTDFIRCMAWRNTAEFISKYFAKGRMMVASGRLQVDNYTDKDGNKRTSTQVVIENAYFGDSKRDGDGGNAGANTNARASGSAQQAQQSAPAASTQQFMELDDEDGDLPF